MKIGQQFILSTAFLSLLSGVVVFSLGLYARSCFNPSHIQFKKDEFIIIKRDSIQSIDFLFIRKNDDQLILILSGTTDIMCDPPYLLYVDVDEDKVCDLYFHNCSGHGYVHYEPETNTLKYVDLGQFDPEDAPVIQSFWSHEIQTKGLKLITCGFSLLIAGLITLFISRISKNST